MPAYDLCRGSGTVLLSRCGRAARRRALFDWSVHAKRQRTELHSRAEAKHCTVELRHSSMRTSHTVTQLTDPKSNFFSHFRSVISLMR